MLPYIAFDPYSFDFGLYIGEYTFDDGDDAFVIQIGFGILTFGLYKNTN